jgi:hypothetical protein
MQIETFIAETELPVKFNSVIVLFGRCVGNLSTISIFWVIHRADLRPDHANMHLIYGGACFVGHRKSSDGSAD